MKLALSVMLLALLLCAPAFPVAAVPAFPGAEGFGATALGGRGGAVIYVTNLNDSGTGSLRACVNASGPRTCVFRVGGTITLSSGLRISNPFITIAGQTAPGDGIQLRATSAITGALLSIRTSDVVVRYIRVRHGILAGTACCRDSVSLASGERIILDHVSVQWGADENVEIWGANNITIQNSIIAEGLMTHSMGVLIGNGSTNMSLHHNLFASNNQRSPRQQGGLLDFRNNVIYNYGNIMGSLSSNSRLNYIGNTIKKGPSGKGSEACVSTTSGDQVYFLGNSKSHSQPDKSGSGTTVSTPFAVPSVTTQAAADAYAAVLADAGASLPRRDAVDSRIVAYVVSGGGTLISDPSAVGAYPTLASGTPYPDADLDGMDDRWEADNGLDPANAADRNQDADGDGFTNLEEFLNGEDAGGEPTPPDILPPSIPQGLTAMAVSSSQIDLTWQASSDDVGVTGYDVFRGGIDHADTTAAAFSDTVLAPGIRYTYRVRAKDAAGNVSELSSTAEARTDDMPPPPPSPPPPSSLDRQVSASSDDAEYTTSGSRRDTTSSDLEMIRDGSTQQQVCIRFRNITIPRGARITAAHVQFTADAGSSSSVSSGSGNLTFRAIDQDDTASCNSSAASRQRTSASVVWTSVPAWTRQASGAAQRTPNLARVLQEVIDRTGWVSGNDLALWITGTSNIRRNAESYDGSRSRAPRLRVEWN